MKPTTQKGAPRQGEATPRRHKLTKTSNPNLSYPLPPLFPCLPYPIPGQTHVAKVGSSVGFASMDLARLG